MLLQVQIIWFNHQINMNINQQLQENMFRDLQSYKMETNPLLDGSKALSRTLEILRS